MENGFQKARQELARMGRTVESCPFRTRFHIMPPVGWLNDPNGLCQFKGVFHAYFQYSPLSVHGGGGYWGHCTSQDLLHWEYHEPVLTTDIPEDRSGVYSGSALIEDEKMYLFYTGNVKLPGDYDYIDQGRISTQLLTESEDGYHMSRKIKLLGIEDYPSDMTEHIRDPKVWKEGNRYYMVLGARGRAVDEEGRRRDKGGVLIYTSLDKKEWKLHREMLSENYFGYMWECPDIFYLDGNRVLSFCPQGLPEEKERFQNIYQSGYCIMDLSMNDLGETVDTDSFREWDMGFDFYAPQTFETEDGRRILIGWAGVPDTEHSHRNLSVENGWQHCLTLPGELTWKDGKILRMPARELESLDWEHETEFRKKRMSPIAEQKEQENETGQEEAEEYCWSGKTVMLNISELGGERIRIRAGSKENAMVISASGDRVELSFLDESGNPAPCGGGRRIRVGRTEDEVNQLMVLIDSSIVEIYVNQGELVFTSRFYLENQERRLEVTGGGSLILKTISHD